MGKTVSVTTLAKNCPLFIHLSQKYPLRKETMETIFGSIVHAAVQELVKSRSSSISEALTTLKRVSSNRLELTMLSDPVMLQVIKRHLTKVKAILGKLPEPLEVELPVEYNIGDFTIKGRIDAIFPGTPPIIVDWKTGSFSSKEHEFQLQIYAYISWKANILSPPIKVLGIYLGEEGSIKTVEATLTISDLTETGDRIIELLEKSIKGIPPVNPSSSCTFCPYRFRCASYYSETVMAKVWERVQKSNTISQQRRLGYKILKLSDKLKEMGTKLVNKKTPQNFTPFRVDFKNQNNIWGSQLKHVLPHLEEEELRDLLSVMSAEIRDIDLEKLPTKVREILRKLGKI